jgi:hypothetical protein
VPLHPEAARVRRALPVQHRVLAAYRPTGKGRVERQVSIVRDHVLSGRSFDSIAELDGAFAAWLPIRMAQMHRTHGQVSPSAEQDRAALSALPDQPLPGHRPAPAQGREELPGLLRGVLLLGAGPPGLARAASAVAGPARRGRRRPGDQVLRS